MYKTNDIKYTGKIIIIIVIIHAFIGPNSTQKKPKKPVRHFIESEVRFTRQMCSVRAPTCPIHVHPYRNVVCLHPHLQYIIYAPTYCATLYSRDQSESLHTFDRPHLSDKDGVAHKSHSIRPQIFQVNIYGRFDPSFRSIVWMDIGYILYF